MALQTYPTARPPPQRAWQVGSAEQERGLGFVQGADGEARSGADDMRRLDVLVAVATGEQGVVPLMP
jgi:hypothetical protein